MVEKLYLSIPDYVVITITLLISVVIGFKFRRTGSNKSTTRDYLLAGKNMSQFPVILSISVTMISAVSMIGAPAEVYRYGVQAVLFPLAIPIGMFLAAHFLLPVYFECGVTTVYEFLELRFGKVTRYTISFFFIIQTVLYMGTVLYAPVLALSSVTNLSIELSLVLFGGICACYCAVGGLKGVLWTDAFQFVLMMTTLVIVYIFSISDAGGIANIYNRAREGGRQELLKLTFDPTIRYTFWNTMLSGIVFGFGCYGTSQMEVQRLLSLSDYKKAKKSLLLSSISVALLYLLCHLTGIIYYAIYYTCDPVTNWKETGVKKYDQILPYYIVTRFQSYPGLTGLCVSGIFSGSLSTISSALNSLATVTVVDFVRPFVPSNRLTERKSVLLSKILSLFYGLMCISLSFAMFGVSSIMQISNVMYSTLEGPLSAVVAVGILTKRVRWKSAMFGFLVGVSLTSWMSSGSLLNVYLEPSLPFNSSTCPSTTSSPLLFKNSSCSSYGDCSTTISSLPPVVPGSDTFVFYKFSFLWIRVLGFAASMIAIFVSTIFTDCFANNSAVKS